MPPIAKRKIGITIKIVRFFLFRNLSSERQVKARNPDATDAGGLITYLVQILPLCSISIEVETMRRTTASPRRA
jgi:hypothetical protein